MNIELNGIELLYYLMKRFNMSYNQAIKEMIKHNQDLSFLDDIKVKDIKKYYINKHIDLGH